MKLTPALLTLVLMLVSGPGSAQLSSTERAAEIQPAEALGQYAGTYAPFAGSPRFITVDIRNGKLNMTDSRGRALAMESTPTAHEFLAGDRTATFSASIASTDGVIDTLELSSGVSRARFIETTSLEAEYRKTAGTLRPHAVSDAVLMNDAPSLRKLIKAGADVNELDTRVQRAGRNGRRPLNWAAFSNHTEMIELLIDAGADLHLTNRSGYTPLHHAAEAGAFDAAKLLIDRGADPQLDNARGQTPLDVALYRNQRSLIQLFEAAADTQTCASEDCAPPTLASTNYQVPDDIGDGLQVRPLDQAARDLTPIVRLLKKLDQGDYNAVDSLLIVKNGKLVVEQYYGDWTRERPHMMQSVSKSITSLLIGSALHQGLLKSVEEPIRHHLPDYAALLQGGKAKITIEDLLTMSAGFDWNEGDPPYGHPENVRGKEVLSPEPVTFTLETDFVHEPGQVFTYSGGYVTIVGVILEKLFQTDSVLKALQASSLAKLGFESLAWMPQNGGFHNTAGGVLMRPRDLAKIGQLMLNGGTWQGERILSEEWVEASLARHVSPPSSWDEYGYFWWGTELTTDKATYQVDAARGWGGQELILVQELDLAIVLTATNYQTPTPLEGILTTSILPAFE